MSEGGLNAVIIDNGTYTIKAGYSSLNNPGIVLQTLVGKSKNIDIKSQIYFGNECNGKRDVLTVTKPIMKRTIINYNIMEQLWKYILHKKLKCITDETPILITEQPMNDKINREKTLEIFFESFNIPSIYLGNQCELTCYSKNLLNCCVLDSGYDTTYCNPIFNGYSLKYATKKINLGGIHLDKYLYQLISKSQKNKTKYFNQLNFENLDVIQHIKHNLCYTSMQIRTQKKANKQAGLASIKYKYKLPDGKTIELKNEIRDVCESLFDPKLCGVKKDYNNDNNLHKKNNSSLFYKLKNNDKTYAQQNIQEIGIDKLILKSLNDINDNKMKDILYHNIILSGGNTLFKGLAKRIKNELLYKLNNFPKYKYNSNTNYNVRTFDTKSKFSVWIGGSILCQQSNFMSEFVSKDEYNEYGPKIVHRKCF